MDDQNKEPVEQEGVEVSAETTAADPMLQTDAVIKRYLKQIRELGIQLREKAGQFKDSFQNDAEFHSVDKEVKEVQRKLKQAKEILSTYLQKYVTETGLNTIEDDEGEVLKIVPVYKLEKEKTER